MEIYELKKIIEENGIVGAGGAGFPSHAKLSKGVETVIVNCAECEPLFRVDRQLLSIYTENILNSLHIIMEVLKAKKGIIALKPTYTKTITAVQSIINQYKNMEISILPDVYPAGDEVVLVYEATGRIVPEGAIPLSVGVLVYNVETVFNIYNAILVKEPVIYKYVTVAGEVNNPVTVKLPIGTSIREAINIAGGIKIKNYEILSGGPMTGRLASVNDNITKTTKAILVLPEDHPVILKKKEKSSITLKRVMSVCSQCQMCTDLCPRHLLGYSLRPNRIMRAVGNGLTSDISAFTSSFLCSECGLCEMYSCHQGLSPRRIIGELKMGLKKNGVKNPCLKTPASVDIMRYGRMVPMDRIIARLGLNKYNVDAPIKEDLLPVKKVRILLNQHIGTKAVPIVEVGEKVVKGQLIGDIENGKLGAKVHASINGTVREINASYIIIDQEYTRGENIG